MERLILAILGVGIGFAGGCWLTRRRRPAQSGEETQKERDKQELILEWLYGDNAAPKGKERK